MLDNEICDFLVEIQKLRYLKFVDDIQKKFEEDIAKVFRKIVE